MSCLLWSVLDLAPRPYFLPLLDYVLPGPASMVTEGNSVKRKKSQTIFCGQSTRLHVQTVPAALIQLPRAVRASVMIEVYQLLPAHKARKPRPCPYHRQYDELVFPKYSESKWAFEPGMILQPQQETNPRSQLLL
jgi:hypothetical protein